jgi:hypothetical protein
MPYFSDSARSLLLEKIHGILRSAPGKMYSKEEIMNLLAGLDKDLEIESILGELEVNSSSDEAKAGIYAKCRGGTVYYKWNNA